MLPKNNKNNGFKGMIRAIFDQEKELPAEDREPEALPITEADPERVKMPEQPVGVLPPMKGALLQLWHRWAGETMPPELSLIGTLDERQIHLDKIQLEREALRLAVQLEKDARKRVQEIEAAEQRETMPLNARCHVYISRDKMLAWLFLFPPVGEEGTLLMEDIGGALQNYKVTSGIDSSMVVRAFQEKSYFRLLPIAVGTPPVQGTDGSIVEHYAHSLEFEVKIDENGLADYKSSNYVRQIYKDDVICDIILPVPGQPGLCVDGSIVDPKPVRAAKVPRGSNTTVTEDGLYLIATMDGHLEYRNEAFQVRPVMVIQGDVDYEVGNIVFTGDVHVMGDVRENFCVNATGSVVIEGLVEAATVEAGGDLTITRGVVGDNRALLRSRGTIRVKYLENCVVFAGRGVYADCIMNSQVFSDTVIVCSGRGSIIGGALTAAECIRAKMIGAQSGRLTELTLGVLPYVQHELQSIQGDIEIVRQEQEELEKELAYLAQRQGLEGSDARLAKARMRRSVLEMKIQQFTRRQERLEPMVPDVGRCRLECGVVYPNTTLTVRERVWTARDVKKSCKVVYDVREEVLKEVY